MPKTIFIIICLSLIAKLGIAQTSDSLRYELYKSKASSYYFSHPDSNYTYSDSLILLGQQSGYKKALAYGLKMRGVYYHMQAINDSALSYYVESQHVYLEIPDVENAAKSELNAGMVHLNLGQFDSALIYVMNALRVFEELNNQDMIGRSISEVAKIHSLSGDHDKALPYFRKALELAITSENPVSISHAYSFMTSVHNYLLQYDSAIYYAHKTIKLYQAMDNKNGIGGMYVNLANAFKDQQQFDSAQFYYQQAINVHSEIQNDRGLGEAFYNLGVLNMESKNFSAAQVNFEKALKHSQLTNHADLLTLIKRDLAMASAKVGDFEKAYEYQVMYQSSNDSVFNQQKQQTITELQTQYETTKKEQQIALQEVALQAKDTDLKLNRLLLIGLLILTILLIVIGMLLWKRMLWKQNTLLEKEKTKAKEAQLNATLNSQENERKRFARDLHDGFGQLISLLNMNLRELNTNRDNQQEVFNKSSEVIDHMYTELKNICFNLMPDTLIKNGIVDAVQEFAMRINHSEKIKIELSFFGLEERLTDLQEISLYRITQEWINNILKYGSANQIIISLTKDEEEITLLIEDNGQGFDTSLLKEGKGNGWNNIYARTNLIKGTVDIETQLGSIGSALIINAPCRLVGVTVATN